LSDRKRDRGGWREAVGCRDAGSGRHQGRAERSAGPEVAPAVQAELDDTPYPKGIKISDLDMQTLETTGTLTRDDFHGEWNYRLNPRHRDTPEMNNVK